VFKILGLALLLASPRAAVAQQVNVIQPDTHFEDSVDRLKSSSDLVVGAVFAGGGMRPEVPRFRASIAHDLIGSRLCLRTRSVDGFYQGRYDYTIPADGAAGPALDFGYPTEFADLVSSPPNEGFAIAAYTGGCDTDSGEIYVGFWNTIDRTGADEVLLTLNTVGGSAAYVFVGDHVSAPEVTCRKVDSPRTKGFDFTCTLPIPPEMSGHVNLEIQVRRGSTRDKARFEKLWIER
jgi:hypothetical protein